MAVSGETKADQHDLLTFPREVWKDLRIGGIIAALLLLSGCGGVQGVKPVEIPRLDIRSADPDGLMMLTTDRHTAISHYREQRRLPGGLSAMRL